MQSSQAGTPDSDELAQFREQWKAEVNRKKGQSSAPSGPRPEASDVPAPGAEPKPTTSPVQLPQLKAPFVPDAAAPVPKANPETSSTPYGKTLARAVEVYRRAVQCEQQSDLDEALTLYRMAFRLDSNVDRAYHKLETQLQLQYPAVSPSHSTASGTSAHAQKPSAAASNDGVEQATQALKALDMHSVVIPVAHIGSAVATGTLANLLASWPRDLAFEPEDERAPAPLQRLPDELLVLILRSLDTSTLEKFGTVSRKARVVTLDGEIWRNFVQAVYKSPQIPIDEDVNTLLHQYMSDHRRLYIEHPRLRLDGVYIAVCHYIRSGLSEHPWVNVSHLITYHRYLRFYPNGQVISLLANEEMPPQQVIPVLKPTLRMKGLSIGNWRLSGNIVHVTDLLDPSAGSRLRYAFQMMLELRSRPLGRWNKLEFRSYDSVDIESGEATPVPLKHERPFWFSKVKSYA